MRAAHIVRGGSPKDAIEVVEIDEPVPGPGEVRVRVEACALNRLDVFARIGHPGDDGRFPKQSGGDIAGVVDALGEGVSGWNAGDSVVVYPGVTCNDCEFCLNGEHTMCADYQIIGEQLPGGLAEYVVVPASVLDPLPEPLDFVTGAAWPVAFTTAWRMLVTAGGLRPAESALILGASGGVGHAALQIANRLGATTYATTSSPEKAEIASTWADEVIDYTQVDFAERVRNLTDGRGVDLVADHVGQKTWQTSIDSLAMNGRMVICGATSGASPGIDIRSVYQHHRKIIGAPMGNRQDFRDVGRLIAHGELTPRIDRVLPLAQLADGHEALENREVFGKVVIQPQQ